MHKVHAVNKPALPLSAYEDLKSFELYLYDVGLLGRLAGLDPMILTQGTRLFSEFIGSFTENFILNLLLMQNSFNTCYWRSGNTAEIDFLIQAENDLIPVEVKSDKNVCSRSLSEYRKKIKPRLALRHSMQNIHFDGQFLNLPLFFVDCTHAIISDLMK